MKIVILVSMLVLAGCSGRLFYIEGCEYIYNHNIPAETPCYQSVQHFQYAGKTIRGEVVTKYKDEYIFSPVY